MEIENNITHLTCPNCGGSMQLQPGWRWECPYCKTAFYVYPAKKIDLVIQREIVDRKDLERFGDELRNQYRHKLANMIGEYLVNNDYLTFDERSCMNNPEFFDDKHTEFISSLRVVKKEN